MNDITKLEEEADRLVGALGCIREICNASSCDECIFRTIDDCVLATEPDKWNIGKIAINIGKIIGKKEVS